MCSRIGSRSFRASSGSRSASNSIEPFMSANNTVTCLRSPSRAFFVMRILSARCLGVYASTEPNFPEVTKAAGAASSSRCPHCLQNFAPSRVAPPQFGQTTSSREPQFSQNTASPGFWAWHCRQFISTSQVVESKMLKTIQFNLKTNETMSRYDVLEAPSTQAGGLDLSQPVQS